MYEKSQYIVYGIRGVCKVTDIITIDHPVGPKGRLYYELRNIYPLIYAIYYVNTVEIVEIEKQYKQECV